MATLISKASGNFTAAATWAPVSTAAGSFLDAQNGSVAGTVALAYPTATFVPAAVEIDAIVVKVASRTANATGTITVKLANITSPGNREISVTLNVADIPYVGTTQAGHLGWYVFKAAVPITPNGTDAYKVGFSTSVAGTVSLYRSATASDWSRMLRLTSAASAPTTDDNLFIVGEWAAGTPDVQTSFTVTMDNTATTSFGVMNATTASIGVGNGGTLQYGTADSTNYYLKFKGIFFVWAGGTLNIGTSGTPIPATSTAVLEMASVTKADSSLNFTRGSTVNMYGASKATVKTWLTSHIGGVGYGETLTSPTRYRFHRQYGQPFGGVAGTIYFNGNYLSETDVVSSIIDEDTLALAVSMTNDAVTYVQSGQRTLTVESTDGWAAGDVLALTPCCRLQWEYATIASVDSATQVTLNADLSYAHFGGTAPFRSMAGNITRNVKIRGLGTGSTQGAILNRGTFTARYAEFSSMGSNTTGKQGVDFVAGDVDIRYCSFHDFLEQGAHIGHASAEYTTISYQDNISVNIYEANFEISALYCTITCCKNNLMIGVGSGSGYGIRLDTNTDNASPDFSGNVLAGMAMYGISLRASYLNPNLDNTICIQCDYGINISANINLRSITGCVFWRNNTSGVFFDSGATNPAVGFTFTDCMFIGCGSQGINTYVTAALTLINCTAGGELGQSQPRLGITVTQTAALFIIRLYDCHIGAGDLPLVGHSIADFSYGGSVLTQIHAFNTKLPLGMVGYNMDASMEDISFIQSDSADYHATDTPGGRCTRDSAIYRTATPSLRMHRRMGNHPLQSSLRGRGMQMAVSAGQTATPSVYVRKSVSGDGDAYNGGVPELVVRANPEAGIATDTVLATHSGSAGWVLLTGTTAAVAADCVLEFFINLPTAGGADYLGWVNVDDWSCTPANQDQGNLKFWLYGAPGGALAMGGTAAPKPHGWV